MARRLTIPHFGAICRLALVSLWGASAVGHAVLLIARWERLSLFQVFTIALAILGSAALAHLSRWMLARPTRLLVIALLVGMAHLPAHSEGVPIFALLPAAVAALGLAALEGSGPERRAKRMPLRTLCLVPCDVTAPRALTLCFDLQSRPPPVC